MFFNVHLPSNIFFTIMWLLHTNHSNCPQGNQGQHHLHRMQLHLPQDDHLMSGIVLQYLALHWCSHSDWFLPPHDKEHPMNMIEEVDEELQAQVIQEYAGYLIIMWSWWIDIHNPVIQEILDEDTFEGYKLIGRPFSSLLALLKAQIVVDKGEIIQLLLSELAVPCTLNGIKCAPVVLTTNGCTRLA